MISCIRFIRQNAPVFSIMQLEIPIAIFISGSSPNNVLGKGLNGGGQDRGSLYIITTVSIINLARLYYYVTTSGIYRYMGSYLVF